VDPDDGQPVQVELAWPSREQSYVYADIRIDEQLDEGLFSFEPPAGYALRRAPQGDEFTGQMLAKARRLALECVVYASKHDGNWPATLEDLQHGGLDQQTFRTLVSAPGADDGKAVFLYRQPHAEENDAIIVYEAPRVRGKHGVICGFSSGHAELVPLEQFQKQMKQPAGGGQIRPRR
jgi:hypothetical protein